MIIVSVGAVRIPVVAVVVNDPEDILEQAKMVLLAPVPFKIVQYQMKVQVEII